MQAWLSRCRGFARDWLPAVAWTLFIYATIPLARAIQLWVTEHATRALFSWIVYAAIAVAVLWAVIHLRRRAIALTRAQGAILLALAAVFAAGTWWLRANAEEAMHLLQYGVLSALLFRAFSRRYPDRGAYAAAFFLGALLGTLDEVIQWAVPRRFFDFRDMGINAGSVLLVQLALAAGLSADAWRRPATHRSARAAWRLAAAFLALLLACISNTPDVWRPFYSYRPALFVYEEAMIEYGHRHHDPAIGTFNSRLSLDALRAEDAARAEEVGALIRRRGSDDEYGTFLARYSPYTDPFAHEFRVRLFRRDRYWQDARAHRRSPERHAERITIAFGEQRILESWYGESLRASGRDWAPDLRARAEAAARPGPYHSPVSRELVTAWSERQAQAVLGALLLVTMAAGAYDVRRRKTGPPAAQPT